MHLIWTNWLGKVAWTSKGGRVCWILSPHHQKKCSNSSNRHFWEGNFVVHPPQKNTKKSKSTSWLGHIPQNMWTLPPFWLFLYQNSRHPPKKNKSGIQRDPPPKLVEFHIQSLKNRWKWSTPSPKKYTPTPLEVFDIFL